MAARTAGGLSAMPGWLPDLFTLSIKMLRIRASRLLEGRVLKE